MEAVYFTSDQSRITLGEKLGGGGEGEIWSVQGSTSQVAKLYHDGFGGRGKEAKLKAMLANPPQDEMRRRYNHVSIAWPNGLLYSSTGFSGFLMPRLPASNTILEVYNPAIRKRRCPGFNWKYLLHTGLNLARAISALHEKDCIMGDINEGNILVSSTALVSLIDTDSYQVTAANGRVFRCPVGKEEFTPPELHGGSFDKVDRLPEHDYFGLAVVIFLLLMEGNHPFAGVLKTDLALEGPSNVYCLKQGAFPYTRNSLVAPRPTAPRFEDLPREVQRLLKACFVTGHTAPKMRPTAQEWVSVLEVAESHLKHCKRAENHYYSGHLRACPWCERTAALQTPLPPAPKPSANAKPASSNAPAAAPPASSSQPGLAPQNLARQGSTQPRSAQPQTTRQMQTQQQAAQQIAALLRAAGIRPAVSTPPHASAPSTWPAWLQRVYRQAPPGLKFWWSAAWLPMLIGLGAGVALFYIIQWLFEAPQFSRLAAGVLAGAASWTPFLYVARLAYGTSEVGRRYIGPLLVFSGLGAGIAIGSYTTGLADTLMATRGIQPSWLLAASLIFGLLEGAALGSFRPLRRRFSRQATAAISVVLALIPPLLLALSGALGRAFP